ncbi:hypothetical protein FOA52_006505 [Chlamydomonas sp. UWO 241]|nr:hypothetical protein FOA52_006505 [Chlamydomonas sp. UWO 241]
MLAPSAWRCMGAARPPGSPPRSQLLAAHAGIRRPTASLGMLTRAPASGGGARVLQPPRRPVLAAAMQEGGHAKGGGPDGRKPRRYKGVTCLKGRSAWVVHLYNPETKRQQHIGSYDSEEDAARAYDCAAVKLHGPGYAKHNFPGEIISEPPASRGDAKSSRFNGVSKEQSSWVVYLYSPETKRPRRIGSYASEVDAARAYDCAAVKLHGPGWPKRNFPGEVISEPPVSLGAKRKERKASRFSFGVTWNKASSAWAASLYKPQRKHIGTYASEVDAARAYDCAAVKLHGPGYAKRNFPGEAISEPPVSLGDAKSSRFNGVAFLKDRSAWAAQLQNPESKRVQRIGSYDSEEDAARAYDCAAVKLHGPDWPKRNFPGEVIARLPASRGGKPRERKASQ